MPPGERREGRAAGGVERHANRQIVSNLPDSEPRGLDKVVGLVVVAPRPGVITFLGGDRRGRHPVAEFTGGIEQGANLGEAGAGEVAIVFAVERPQQSPALQREQIGERVLVDHRAMV